MYGHILQEKRPLVKNFFAPGVYFFCLALLHPVRYNGEDLGEMIGFLGDTRCYSGCDGNLFIIEEIGYV